ncbi:uncharacterized protein [Aristolochia californica]|uniref:uncharacterized protein n=1 Tax=Aristolochia californica TaxID=171875 RepID=UPI0035D97BC1
MTAMLRQNAEREKRGRPREKGSQEAERLGLPCFATEVEREWRERPREREEGRREGGREGGRERREAGRSRGSTSRALRRRLRGRGEGGRLTGRKYRREKSPHVFFSIFNEGLVEPPLISQSWMKIPISVMFFSPGRFASRVSLSNFSAVWNDS